jgi:hypothetical protein
MMKIGPTKDKSMAQAKALGVLIGPVCASSWVSLIRTFCVGTNEKEIIASDMLPPS